MIDDDDLALAREQGAEARAWRLIGLAVAHRATMSPPRMTLVDAALEVEAAVGVLKKTFLDRLATPASSK